MCQSEFPLRCVSFVSFFQALFETCSEATCCNSLYFVVSSLVFVVFIFYLFYFFFAVVETKSHLNEQIFFFFCAYKVRDSDPKDPKREKIVQLIDDFRISAPTGERIFSRTETTSLRNDSVARLLLDLEGSAFNAVAARSAHITSLWGKQNKTNKAP